MKSKCSIIVWSTVVVVLLFFGYGCRPADTTPVSLGELDSLHLLNLDSTALHLTPQDLRSSLMAVVFNPWCDHCQAEAMQIYLNMNQLNDVTILMIGMVNLNSLKDFGVKYRLNNFKNVIFAYCNPRSAYDLLGAYDLPHIRLYDAGLNPVKDFSGPNTFNQVLAEIKAGSTTP